MKKGFTLLELIVVVIILGILATLGLTQYQRMVEKSRGAEARMILGAIRTQAASVYINFNNDCTNCNAANLGVGSDYPSACATTHYFSYAITANDATGFTAVANRCVAGGKTPQGPAGGGSITLTTNFASGQDAWTYTALYQ